MRELVYLSEAKLTQFVRQKKRKRLTGRIKLEGEVRIPGAGSIKAAAPDGAIDKTPDLEEVVLELEVSPRSAGWYTNPQAQPGQWVEFEAALNHTVLPAADGSVAVFTDANTLESADSPRLLLHGSPIHLRGVVAPANMATVTRQFGLAHGSGFDFTLAALSELFNVLEGDKLSSPMGSSLPQRRHSFGVDMAITDFRRGDGEFMWGLLDALERAVFTYNTAAWMSGWARITCVLDDPYGDEQRRLLVATPLYVQYATPPDSNQA